MQVVIDNDTSSIETAIATFVTDYNATIKAINAQEGKDSSGNPEPLYGTGVAAQIQGGLAVCDERILRHKCHQFADRPGHHGEADALTAPSPSTLTS